MRWRRERRGSGSRCKAKLSQRVPNHSTRKRAATGDRRRTECTRRHAETSAVRNEALVERDSVDCGRWREQQELSDRRGSRRRPSTAELGGNLLRCGDGPSDAHGPAAAGANGDVDAEDAGQERHPGHARRGSIAELSVQQGVDGGELERTRTASWTRSPGHAAPPRSRPRTSRAAPVPTRARALGSALHAGTRAVLEPP